ncbi:hypothetical protein CEUSTIGMA_g431.t1, partial [Chlamydomonas eustigma]
MGGVQTVDRMTNKTADVVGQAADSSISPASPACTNPDDDFEAATSSRPAPGGDDIIMDIWNLMPWAKERYGNSLSVVDLSAAGGVKSPDQAGILTYSQFTTSCVQLAAHMWTEKGMRRGTCIGVMLRNSVEVLQAHFAAAATHSIIVNVNVGLTGPELAHVLTDSGCQVLIVDTEFRSIVAAAAADLTLTNIANDTATASPSLKTIIWVVKPNVNINPILLQELKLCLRGLTNVMFRDCFMLEMTTERFMPWRDKQAVNEGFNADDGFHMYYTSGTTGRPKGVLLSHRIVMMHALGCIQEMHLNHQDVWLHAAPLFHLVDVFAVYSITLVGGRHIILPTFNAQEALITIERERVTVSNVASTMAALMASNPILPVLDLTCLRLLSCGGSPQPPSVVRSCIAQLGCEFFLSYGMTECCGKISMSILPEAWRKHKATQLLKQQAVLSIESEASSSAAYNFTSADLEAMVCTSGRPFMLMQVRVVQIPAEGEDEVDEEELPPCGSSCAIDKIKQYVDIVPGSGAVGEVWCRGPTVFQGYWKDEKATQESFMPGGWFRTGDLATVDVHGYMTVVDRKKDMILVGGENVYCTEVEAACVSHPSVAAAAAFALPSQVMGEMVAVAVVLKVEEEQQVKGVNHKLVVDEKELMEWCRSRLAHYKLPSQVSFVDGLPTTSSGKVMKTRLRSQLVPVEGQRLSPTGESRSADALPSSQPHPIPHNTQHVISEAYLLASSNPSLPLCLPPKEAARAPTHDHHNVHLQASLSSLESAMLSVQSAFRNRLPVCFELAEGAGWDLDPTSTQILIVDNNSDVIEQVRKVVHGGMSCSCSLLGLLSGSVTDQLISELSVMQGSNDPQLRGLALHIAAIPQECLCASGITTVPETVAKKRREVLRYSILCAVENMPPLGSLLVPHWFPRLQPPSPKLPGEACRTDVNLIGGAENPTLISWRQDDLFLAPVQRSQGALSSSVDSKAAEIALSEQHGTPAVHEDSFGVLQNIVLRAVKEVLMLGPGSTEQHDLDVDVPLMNMGLTSTTAVQLTTTLEDWLGSSLSPTLVFDYPTVTDICQYLVSEGHSSAVSQQPGKHHGNKQLLQSQEITMLNPMLGTAGACGGSADNSIRICSRVVTSSYAAAESGRSSSSCEEAPLQGSIRCNNLMAALTSIFRSIVGLSVDDASVDPTTPLMNLGLTSSTAVQFTSALEDKLGASLPPTLVFDYPSLAEMTEFLELEGFGVLPSNWPQQMTASLGPVAADLQHIAVSHNVQCMMTSQSVAALRTGGSSSGLGAHIDDQHVPVLERIRWMLAETFNTVTGLPKDLPVDDSVPLINLGMTSTTAVQFTSALEEKLGVSLPPTLVFDYPSLTEIAEYILSESAVMPQQTETPFPPHHHHLPSPPPPPPPPPLLPPLSPPPPPHLSSADLVITPVNLLQPNQLSPGVLSRAPCTVEGIERTFIVTEMGTSAPSPVLRNTAQTANDSQQHEEAMAHAIEALHKALRRRVPVLPILQSSGVMSNVDLSANSTLILPLTPHMSIVDQLKAVQSDLRAAFSSATGMVRSIYLMAVHGGHIPSQEVTALALLLRELRIQGFTVNIMEVSSALIMTMPERHGSKGMELRYCVLSAAQGMPTLSYILAPLRYTAMAEQSNQVPNEPKVGINRVDHNATTASQPPPADAASPTLPKRSPSSFPAASTPSSTLKGRSIKLPLSSTLIPLTGCGAHPGSSSTARSHPSGLTQLATRHNQLVPAVSSFPSQHTFISTGQSHGFQNPSPVPSICGLASSGPLLRGRVIPLNLPPSQQPPSSQQLNQPQGPTSRTSTSIMPALPAASIAPSTALALKALPSTSGSHVLLAISAACHVAPGGGLDGQSLGMPYGFAHSSAFYSSRRQGCIPHQGTDRSSVPPLARWDIEAETFAAATAAGEQLPMRFGSFLESAELFDATAFGLSKAEATLMDPQQRLLLESFAMLRYDDHQQTASSVPSSTTATSTAFAPQSSSPIVGVYVGVSQLEYARMILDQRVPVNAYYATGAHLSVTSGRLSFAFGLRGPAITVDTACSSSLVACHLAASDILRKTLMNKSGSHTSQAGSAVLGVNLTLASSWTQACNRAGMLSLEGRCKTLDASADGYLRAEGCGALMLRPWSPPSINSSSDAPGANVQVAADLGERSAPAWLPLAVLCGSAVNQDGRSSSLTAPNGPSQQAVIRFALAEGGLETGQLSKLELHGTGTPLGDPIEVGAAAAVLNHTSTANRGGTSKVRAGKATPITFTALKAEMGHAEPAAGILGLCRALHQLQHQLTRPLLHLRHLNPYLESSMQTLTTTAPYRQQDTQHPSSSSAAARLDSSVCRALLPRSLAPWSLCRKYSEQAASLMPDSVGGATEQLRHEGGLTGLTVGISAFAFQGTNGHAILAALKPKVVVSSQPSSAQVMPNEAQSYPTYLVVRERFWVHPLVHPLATRVLINHAGASVSLTPSSMLNSTYASSVSIQFQLPSARLSYLMDHRVMGLPLLPAAAMLEMACAAVSTALPDSATTQAGQEQQAGASATNWCISGLTIMRPIIMPQQALGDSNDLGSVHDLPSTSSHESAVLKYRSGDGIIVTCAVLLESGTVQLSSERQGEGNAVGQAAPRAMVATGTVTRVTSALSSLARNDEAAGVTEGCLHALAPAAVSLNMSSSLQARSTSSRLLAIWLGVAEHVSLLASKAAASHYQSGIHPSIQANKHAALTNLSSLPSSPEGRSSRNIFTDSLPQIPSLGRLCSSSCQDPESSGSVQQTSTSWQSEGYLANPGMMDSALHLGVANPGSGAKIPVSAGAFLACNSAIDHPCSLLHDHLWTVLASGPSSLLAGGDKKGEGMRRSMAGRSSSNVVTISCMSNKRKAALHGLETVTMNQRNAPSSSATPLVASKEAAGAAVVMASALRQEQQVLQDDELQVAYEIQWQMSEALPAVESLNELRDLVPRSAALVRDLSSVLAKAPTFVITPQILSSRHFCENATSSTAVEAVASALQIVQGIAASYRLQRDEESAALLPTHLRDILASTGSLGGGGDGGGVLLYPVGDEPNSGRGHKVQHTTCAVSSGVSGLLRTAATEAAKGSWNMQLQNSFSCPPLSAVMPSGRDTISGGLESAASHGQMIKWSPGLLKNLTSSSVSISFGSDGLPTEAPHHEGPSHAELDQFSSVEGHLEEGAAITPCLLAVPQLIRCLPPLMVSEAGGSEWIQLKPRPRGSLGGLVPEKVDMQAAVGSLGFGEVLVAVKAVGVNFRDVLNVLGMYPGDPGEPGSDCAGTVLAMGPLQQQQQLGDSVTGSTYTYNFNVSDSVFGLSHGCLGTIVAGPACMMALVPPGLSLQDAATMPTVFMTVEAALQSNAALLPGETILLHAAAGGVGLAGTQVAYSIGAEVLGTAGGHNKRALLRSLNTGTVKHAAGSRDTLFLEDLLLREGDSRKHIGSVDVVLNSLTSPGMVSASLALLSQGGRMVELGKRDIWGHRRTSQERPDVQYSLLAIDFLPPQLLGGLMASVAQKVAEGKLHPLRSMCYSLASAAAAMRALAQAAHAGKVVVMAPSRGPDLQPGSTQDVARGMQALVTGGTGGLGTLMSSWMVSTGLAARVVLLGRSGRLPLAAATAYPILSGWSQIVLSRAELVTLSADTAFAEDARCAISSAGRSHFDVVLHAAGVLTDAMLGNQTLSHVRRASAPKLGGLTALLGSSASPQGLLTPLSKVVVFSSVASLVGAAGQASYVAANASMDAWACRAEKKGLSCTAVQWGAWSSAGMASETVKARLERLGQGVLSPQAGLEALAQVLKEGFITDSRNLLTVPSLICVNPFKWKKYLQAAERMEQIVPQMYRQLYTEAYPAVSPEPVVMEQAGFIEPMVEGRKVFAALPKPALQTPGTASTVSRAFIQSEVDAALSEVLGSKLEPDQPLMSAGLDSLGAVEYVNLVSRRLGVQLPSTLVFDYPTTAAIAAFIEIKLASKLAGGKTLQKSATVFVDAKGFQTLSGAAAPLQQSQELGQDFLNALILATVAPSHATQLGATLSGPSQFIPSRSLLPSHSNQHAATTATASAVGITGLLCRPLMQNEASGHLNGCACHPHLNMQSATLSWVADSVVPIPLSRWDRHPTAPKSGVSYSGLLKGKSLHAESLGSTSHQLGAQFGAFMVDCEVFDASAFGLSQAEATSMDPQHRLLLESAAELVSSAKTQQQQRQVLVQQDTRGAVHNMKALDALSAPSVAVYVGISWTEYHRLSEVHAGMAGSSTSGPYEAQGAVLSVAAGRISYHLGLTGPSMAIDTACSSSLVATDLAVQQIRQQPLKVRPSELQGALVGGINMMLMPQTTAMFQSAGMLSPDGRCKTLDASADGYVRGEACTMAMLQNFSVIQSLGKNDETDHAKGATPQCYAVLLGTSVNQDGRSSALTAPNGPAQQEVIRQAISNAEASKGLAGGSCQVTSLQMHGTGTSLGDPIEVGAALEVLMDVTLKGDADEQLKATRSRLSLLGNKSTVGHSEPAAGITALAYGVIQIYQQNSAPLLQLRMLNPYVVSAIQNAAEVATGHLMAPRQPQPLSIIPSLVEDQHRQCMGVSAFAFQGTNAHVVMTRHLPEASVGHEQIMNTSSKHEAHVLGFRKLPWEGSTTWVHPTWHVLVDSVSLHAIGIPNLSKTLTAYFECQLTRARHSSLWDHVVADMALLPAAASLSMASSCLVTLLASALPVGRSQSMGILHILPSLLLTNCTLPSPCLLNKMTQKGSSSTSSTPACSSEEQQGLICAVDLTAGKISVMTPVDLTDSHKTRRGDPNVHLSALVGQSTYRQSSEEDAKAHVSKEGVLHASHASHASKCLHLLRHLLARSTPTASSFLSSQPNLSACGAVDVNSVHEAAASFADPSQLDCTLQLAAVAAACLSPKATPSKASGLASDSVTTPYPSPLRVPASLACMPVMQAANTAISAMSSPQNLFSSVVVRRGQSPGSINCNIYIQHYLSAPHTVTHTTSSGRVANRVESSLHSLSGLEAREVQPDSLQRIVAKQQQQKQQSKGATGKQREELPGSKAKTVIKERGDVRRERRRWELGDERTELYDEASTIQGGAVHKDVQAQEPSTLQEVMYEVQRVATGVSSLDLDANNVRHEGAGVRKGELLTLALPTLPSGMMVSAASQLALSQQLVSLTAISHSGHLKTHRLSTVGFKAIRSLAPCITGKSPCELSSNTSGLHALVKTMALEGGGDLSYEEKDPNISVQACSHDSTRPSMAGHPFLTTLELRQTSPGIGCPDHAVEDRDTTGSSCYASVKYHDLLVPSKLLPSSESGLPSTGDFQLVPKPPGSLSSLVPVPVWRSCHDGQRILPSMTVRVKAVGLNFRDLLMVLGMYPGSDLDPPGGDCSGTVLSSSTLPPGTSVFGLAAGCLGTLVHCHPDTMVVMPEQLSFEQAATMPTVFMTAHMAFDKATVVQSGHKVLVHAAAGGVGLASLQVLRDRGALMVATAGGPPKRGLLRSLGSNHVSGSRDTSFIEELVLGCKGMDVILNTLTSPGLVSAALSLINEGGSLVEISKRDIWHSGRAAQERPDVHFNMVAVDFLPSHQVHEAMSQVAAGAARGVLTPLPVAAHGLHSVSSALRQMSQARHVGKVVVSVSLPSNSGSYDLVSNKPPINNSSPVIPLLRNPLEAVTVTGGLGALGILTASWLASQGVKRIILVGRSGRLATQSDRSSAPSSILAGSHEQVADSSTSSAFSCLPPPLLSNSACHSAHVTSIAGDMSASEDVAVVCSCNFQSQVENEHGCTVSGTFLQPGHPSSSPPQLWIHAGGVLSDASLINHTLQGLRSVLAPKMAAASLPSAVTGGSASQGGLLPIRTHVLFSSVASLLGSAGQAGYSFANGVLDEAASALSSSGLPVLSVQWGAWAGAGMAAGGSNTTRPSTATATSDGIVARKIQRLGLMMLPPSLGLQALGQVLGGEVCSALRRVSEVTAVVPFLWPRFLSRLTNKQGSTLRSGDVGAGARGSSSSVLSLPFFFSNFSDQAVAEKTGDGAPTPGNGVGEKVHITGKEATTRDTALQVSQKTGDQKVQQEDVLLSVLSIVEGVTGRSDVALDVPLMSSGLDSLGAVELRNSLEAAFGVSLPSTLVFDYPTIQSIVDYIKSAALFKSGPGYDDSSDDEGSIIGTEEDVSSPSEGEGSSIAGSETSLTVDEVRRRVVEVVADVLGGGFDIDSTMGETPLMASGLDSLGAVELRNTLQTSFQTSLPATLVMDYPTPRAISTFIFTLLKQTTVVNKQLLPSSSTVRSSTIRVRRGMQLLPPSTLSASQGLLRRASLTDNLVGIASMCTITPGCYASTIRTTAAGHLACSAAALSSCLSDKVVDAVGSIPHNRWCVEDHVDLFEKSSGPVRFGAFLPAIELFDATAFGINEREAALMDPQQRLLLLSAAQAIQDASSEHQSMSSSVAGVPRSKWGVFIGVSALDYSRMASRYCPSSITAFTATGSLSLSVAAGRLSYTLDFRGPAMALDTACSSSLVACHSAMEGLSAGGCAGAMVGGVNVTLIPDTPAMFQKAGMLSPEGRCKTLDMSADGYVRAEACGVAMLVPLNANVNEEVQINGNRTSMNTSSLSSLTAIIRGSAVNQDGRSSALTAPNGPAQQEVIRQALSAASVQPSDVTSLQMHGTGTPLGDPIEVGAAAAVYQSSRGSATEECFSYLSSKSIFGHAEPASGVLGMLMGVQSLSNLTQIPINHLHALNPYVLTASQQETRNGSSSGICMPRQHMGRPLSNTERGSSHSQHTYPTAWRKAIKENGQVHDLCGVSAFAFQGTNAHVLLGRASSHLSLHTHLNPEHGASPRSQEGGGAQEWLLLPWHQQYLWLFPPNKQLAQTASILQLGKASRLKAGNNDHERVCMFETPLQASPRLAYIWDHVVNGRPLMPAAAMVEAALAAVTTLLPPDVAVSLQDVKISSPLLLPAIKKSTYFPLLQDDSCGEMTGPTRRSTGMPGEVVMRVLVALNHGSLRLASAVPGSRRTATRHLSAIFSTSPTSPSFSQQLPLSLSDNEVADTREVVTLSLRTRSQLSYSLFSSHAAALSQSNNSSGASSIGCILSALSENVNPGGLQVGGNVIHPAVADSCFQLGAVPHAGSIYDKHNKGSNLQSALPAEHQMRGREGPAHLPLQLRVPTSIQMVLPLSVRDQSVSQSSVSAGGRITSPSAWAIAYQAVSVGAAIPSEAAGTTSGGSYTETRTSFALQLAGCEGVPSGLQSTSSAGCIFKDLVATPIFKAHPVNNMTLTDSHPVVEGIQQLLTTATEGIEVSEEEPGLVYQTHYLVSEPCNGLAFEQALQTEDVPCLVVDQGRRGPLSSAPPGASLLSLMQSLFRITNPEGQNSSSQQSAPVQEFTLKLPSEPLVMSSNKLAGQYSSAGGTQLSSTDVLLDGCWSGMVKTAVLEGGAVPSVMLNTFSMDANAPKHMSSTRAAVTLFPNSSQSSGSVVNDMSMIQCGMLLLPGLLPVASASAVGSKLVEGYRLVPRPPGALSSLVPEAVPTASRVQGQQMTVRVKAVGLNFRDLLVVLGMYPGSDLDPPGGDCSGTVLSSSTLPPGTSVFGLAAGCLGTLVHCHPDTMVVMPEQLSFEQAATMPTVFMTAHMAFDKATVVQSGHKVLVHAAAGGVGLASLQVLRDRGAVMVATAGGPPKRGLLRSLGSNHVSGSRDTSFIEELVLGCKGMDVILNTLTSPGLVSAALSLITEGGNLVEISKRDIWYSGRAAQERPDVNFSMVAVDFLPSHQVHEAMSQVAAGAARGVLTPLPVAAHGLHSVSSALRQMSQARHV